MSLRVVVLVVAFAVSCGGETMHVKKGEPQTAREKMLAEQKANPDRDETGAGKKWSGWRYQGDRKECFFLVGRKCYKSQKAACQAAHCRPPTKCVSEGAGPVAIKCEKK
jgi:hypothetical protein